MEVIKKCKIDIFSSGDIENNNIENIIKDNEDIRKLNEREINIKVEDEKDETKEIKEITDKMDITQGKLVIGLDVLLKKENISYITMVYNTILGVGANSKLFRNVREKESLAYSCGSNYLKRKQNIMIRAGIEIENYEKALDIIKKQLEDIKNGDFTDEDIKSAKNLIFATIDSIEEEQDTEISYYFGQELVKSDVTIKEYRSKIEKVTKEQIEEVANSIKINTIYFLRN